MVTAAMEYWQRRHLWAVESTTRGGLEVLLKAWLRGVADWNAQSAAAARRSVLHLRKSYDI